MSLDKGRDGVLAQIHTNFGQVANYRLGKARSDPEEVKSKGTYPLEYKTCPPVSDVLGKLTGDLDKWELMRHYDLWGSNCQTMARQVREGILKASSGMELHLPGTNERASIVDHNKLIPYFENRFPDWKNGNLVRVPELQIQYAIGVQREGKLVDIYGTSSVVDESAQQQIEMEMKKEYEKLLVKQFGYEGVCKALRGKAFKNPFDNTRISTLSLTIVEF